MKPPFGSDTQVATSVRMLRDGATPGMVAKYLDSEGVPEHSRLQIVSYAQSIVHRRERIIACGIGVGGIIIFAFGVAMFITFRINGFVFTKLPIIVLMVGVMVAMYGFFDALRPRK